MSKFTRLGGFLTLLMCAACSSGTDPESPKKTEPGDPVVNEALGNFSQNGTVVLSGSEFGIHDLEISSGIGPEGWIETNANGTDFENLSGASGWDVGDSSNPPPQITNERAYSGSQSALARVDSQANDGGWQSNLRYHHFSTFERLYFTFWVYRDLISHKGDGNTQWKMWRVNHNGSTSDQAGQILFISFFDGNGDPTLHEWIIHCALDCPDQSYPYCWEEAKPEPYYDPLFDDPYQYIYLNKAGSVPFEDTMPSQREWNRVEVYLERSSPEVYDGSMTYSIWKPGEGRTFTDTLAKTMNRRSTDACRNPQDPWEYLQFQNFFDDNGGSFAEKADFFFDDIYIQAGTQARIEIGDRAVYEDCSKTEIQVPTSWSEESVEFKVNHGGSFSSGDQAFLFVINSAGKVSPGIEITLE